MLVSFWNHERRDDCKGKGEPKKSDTNPAGIPTSVCIRNGLDIERLKQDLDNLEDAQDLEMKRIETELYSHIHRLEKALEKGEENFTKIKIDIAKIEKHFAVLVAKLSIQMNQDSGHADN